MDNSLKNIMSSTSNTYKNLQSETRGTVSKWSKTGLLEGIDNDYERHGMAIMLENQAKQLVTEASPEQAVKWYLRAANNNHTHAQFNLGIKYDKGQTLNYLSKLKRLPISVIQRLYYLKGGARTHKV